MTTRVRQVSGFGMTPEMSSTSKTDTTGSLALMTWVKEPPPTSNIASTVAAWPRAFKTAIGINCMVSEKARLGSFRSPNAHIGKA